ncbi:sensor domain-containing diguanylate cyclase [Caballeronia glebae]|uniref:sensor domain-containing diguanylate cyclase n=1 Tax=Caballeronia glebae TaxID=1777143 RepID=UPI000B35A743|nr:sensor domain-containing diguanylate cyclase [Caballeronia glebae]
MEAHREIIRVDAASDRPALFTTLLHAFSHGGALLGVYDENDYLRYANESFLRMFELEAGQVVTFSDIIINAAHSGRTVRIEASDPLVFVADAQSRRRCHVRDAPQRSFPVDFVNDQWFWCTETLLPNGWIVLTGADITSLKRTERLLSAQRDDALRLSGVDELTGVPNRRFTTAWLDSVLLDRPLGSCPVSVALLDLDHFKSINDTFGHETGDVALRHFAQYCVASLPSRCLFGRLGGEESCSCSLPRAPKKPNPCSTICLGRFRPFPLGYPHRSLSVSPSQPVSQKAMLANRETTCLLARTVLFISRSPAGGAASK